MPFLVHYYGAGFSGLVHSFCGVLFLKDVLQSVCTIFVPNALMTLKEQIVYTCRSSIIIHCFKH